MMPDEYRRRNPERDPSELAYAALAEILRRATLHKTTGHAILRINFNQGGVRAARIGGEEDFK